MATDAPLNAIRARSTVMPHAAREALAIGSARILAALVFALAALLPVIWPLATLAFRSEPMDWMGNFPRILRLLGVSTGLATAVGLLALLLGVPLGIVAFGSRPAQANPLRWLLVVAAFVPLVLIAGGWDGVFGASGLLRVAHWTMPGFAGIIWTAAIHAASAAPMVALVVGASMRSSGLAAQEDAVTHAKLSSVLLFGSVPAMKSSLALAFMLAATPALIDITVTDLFKVRTFAEEVFVEFEAFRPAAATVIGSSMLASGTAFLAMRLLTQMPKLIDGQGWTFSACKVPTASLGTWKLAAAAAFVPLTIAPIGTIWQLGYAAGRWDGPTAATYLWREIAKDTWIAASNLGLAISASVAATATGFLLAIFWLRLQRWHGVVLWLLTWSMLTPGSLLAVTMLELWNIEEPTGLLALGYRTPLVLLVGWLVRLLPWTTLLGALALRSSMPVLESAALEGARGWRLCSFVAGASGNWLATIAAFGAAYAFAELPLAHLLSTPGFDALGVRLFQLLHTGATNQPAALGVLIATIVATLSLTLQQLALRATRTAAN